MRALKTLVLMQLKEKMNLKGEKIISKRFLFGSIFALLKFALIVGLCFALLFLAKFLNLFSLFNTLPVSVITVIFVVMLFISIIASTMSLTKSMYYSYDNPVLLTLPARPTQVYLSKLIVFYIYELVRNFSFMVPMFIAFGMISNYSFAYYPWVLFCFLFISMIPVLLGVILSVPMMWFYNFFRQYKRLQIGCLVFLIAGITLVVVKAIDIIPSNIDLVRQWNTLFWQIQEFLANFVVDFKIFHSLVMMIVNITSKNTAILVSSSLLTFVYSLLGLLLLFGIGMLIVKPLFYKMASKPFEYRQNKTKSRKNKVLPKKYSSYKTELLLNIREPGRLFTNIGLLIALPVLVFFLNKMFAAMNTRMLGNNMAVAFNILIILLISLSSNNYAASAFSRDGRSSYLIKVQPSKYQPLLISKLVFNVVFMTIAFIATYFILVYSSSLSSIESLLIIISTFTLYIAHLCYSAELDIMNPKTELYATIGNPENNPNETRSTVLAFLGSFMMFGISLLLLIENSGIITYIKFAVIGMILMIARIYMLLNKIKLYYMEK